ncbi:MAG: hypothetical protein JWQ58_2279 [Reyranella sp.]|nr:hypothetical protein [Reyranella sp.]
MLFAPRALKDPGSLPLFKNADLAIELPQHVDLVEAL